MGSLDRGAADYLNKKYALLHGALIHLFFSCPVMPQIVMYFLQMHQMLIILGKHGLLARFNLGITFLLTPGQEFSSLLSASIAP